MSFLQPIRTHRLVEITAGPRTRADVVESTRRFADVTRGTRVVLADDGPAASGPTAPPLASMRRVAAPVVVNAGAEAWDIGDGVLCATFKTNGNGLTPDVFRCVSDSLARAEHDFRALLIANDGEFFCAGASLTLITMLAAAKKWDQIRSTLMTFQGVIQRLKYATVPVVAAPFDRTVGGGLEVCFGCSAVQADVETYADLVEFGVGLVPAGGGSLNMLWNSLDAAPYPVRHNGYEHVLQTFTHIVFSRVTTSAEAARSLGFFRKTDGISFNRTRHVAHAKARAVGLAESDYRPPIPRTHVLPGAAGIAKLSTTIDALVDEGHATEHDAKVARKVAEVLCGGASGATRETTEDEMLELEREAFVSVCGEPKTRERIQATLMNKKSLRN